MEVSNRIVIFSRGKLEQIGTPRDVYEQPANEFVARFIGVMNVLELEVQKGVGLVGELRFTAVGREDGEKIRIGFRPIAVQISPNLTQYQYQAVIRHTFFLGVMLRLELELPSGLVLRSRMTKEEYAHMALYEGRKVSLQIRSYRILAQEHEPLGPEMVVPEKAALHMGENI